MTTWDRNLENVKRAQLRAKTHIASLEQQGLVVEKTLKDLAYRPLRKRYTAKQARDYKNLLQKARIVSRARKPFQMPSFQGAQNVSMVGRYQEVVYARPQHIAEDLANALYKSFSYSLSKKTIGKSQAMASSISKILRIDLNLKGKKKYRGYKRIDKFFNEISKKDFVKAFESAYNADPQQLLSSMRTYYSFGLSSPAAKADRKRILTESSKLVFTDNHNLTQEQADALYDYFEHSTVWAKFRNEFNPSDDEKISDKIRDMGDALNNGLSVSDLDDLILKHCDIKEALDEYLSTLNDSN